MATNRAEKRMEYQRCHAIGHRWENIPVTRPPAFGSAIDLRCENCTTIRRDIFSRISGVLITRYYVYPQDYRDYERHDKAWWRASFAEALQQAAREYINAVNEAARPKDPKEGRREARQAKRDWLESVGPLAHGNPTNPSPQPAIKTRQTRRNRNG